VSKIPAIIWSFIQPNSDFVVLSNSFACSLTDHLLRCILLQVTWLEVRAISLNEHMNDSDWCSSAIVGLVGTVALSPVGGYLGKKIQDVQVVKMKLVRLLAFFTEKVRN